MSDQVFISLSDVFCCFFGFCFTLRIFQAFCGETVSGNCVLFVDPEVWLFLFLYGWDMSFFSFFVFNSLNQHATYLLPKAFLSKFGMDAEGKEDPRQEWPL